MKSNSALQRLYLKQNDIGPEGGAAIADALCSNKGVWLFTCYTHSHLQLVEFSFIDNKVNDRAIVRLAQSLITNTTLAKLALISVGVGNEGATALANMLKVCELVVFPDVTNNFAAKQDTFYA